MRVWIYLGPGDWAETTEWYAMMPQPVSVVWKLRRRMYSNYRYDKHYFDHQFGKSDFSTTIIVEDHLFTMEGNCFVFCKNLLTVAQIDGQVSCTVSSFV